MKYIFVILLVFLNSNLLFAIDIEEDFIDDDIVVRDRVSGKKRSYRPCSYSGIKNVIKSKNIKRLKNLNCKNYNVRHYSSFTPLMYAAYYGYGDAVAVLLEKKADINRRTYKKKYSALIYSIKRNHNHIARKMLTHKQINLNAKDRYNNTALIWAIRTENFQMAKKLIQTNLVDLNIRGEKGNTALMWAVLNHANEIIELLKSHGADQKITNREGDTALKIAIKQNELEKAKFELKHNSGKMVAHRGGAKTRSKITKSSVEILMDSKNYKPEEIIKSDINHRDKYGKTPIFYAVETGNKELVRNLIQKGARIDLQDYKGKTLSDYSKNSEMKRIIIAR